MTDGTAVETSHAETRIKALARRAGFHLAAIARAEDLHRERARYLAWIGAGKQGDMQWITPERAGRASRPREVLPDVRSVIAVAMAYWAGPRPADAANRGRVARYAWGRDYHAVLGGSLGELAAALTNEFGGEHRWYVDTGPVMDKAWAARSGLGWYGKNSNILTKQYGSFVVLGEILTTLALNPDNESVENCGACRLCAVACPTGAIELDYSIDSRRCISYLTIELRGPIPRELRPLIGSWVFGCDVCQDVCPPTMAPYLPNQTARRRWSATLRDEMSGRLAEQVPASPAIASPLHSISARRDVDLLWLLALQQEEYAQAFRGTAIKRAKCWMLRRNAAVALGNTGEYGALRPLVMAMCGDEHAVVRGHAAWAVGRLSNRLQVPATNHLQQALACERDAGVRDEILAALQQVAVA